MPSIVNQSTIVVIELVAYLAIICNWGIPGVISGGIIMFFLGEEALQPDRPPDLRKRLGILVTFLTPVVGFVAFWQWLGILPAIVYMGVALGVSVFLEFKNAAQDPG